MRTIKFRGRSIYDKEWHQGDLEYNLADNIACIHTYDKDGYYVRKYYVNPDTIGQFTGLIDKNGNEIYEGDILLFGNSQSGVCEVKWNESIAAFCILFYFEDEIGSRPLGGCVEFAIIGNIHDNPELLKE